jgi:hypothetical protein
MKFLSLLLAFLTGVTITAALYPFLTKPKVPDFSIGTWKSNYEKTIDFNRKHSLMPGANIQNFEQLFGKLELTVSENGVTSHMPSYEMNSHSGNTFSMPELNENVISEIIYSDDEFIITKMTDEFVGEYINVAKFNPEKNEYWVYLGYSPLNDFIGMQYHYREYFTKIPTKP